MSTLTDVITHVPSHLWNSFSTAIYSKSSPTRKRKSVPCKSNHPTETMPKEQSRNRRTRASVPRPRSGCTTCKRRHVKCDETKPACRKCVLTGRTCDGYPDVTTKGGSRLSALASTLSIASYEIPFKIPGSQNDRRIFHYFCVHAVVDLAGSTASSFWNRIVLQCSQDEPVVRSALLALSYEHLNYVTREPDERQWGAGLESASVEGLQQHHKAVRQLRKYIGTNRRPSVKAVLVCCLLFYYFECSRGDFQTAILHLRNGLAILCSEHQARESFMNLASPSADADLAEIMLAFGLVDVSVSQLDAARMPELDLTTESERSGAESCCDPIVNGLESIADAFRVRVKLANWALRFMVVSQPFKFMDAQALPLALLQEKQELEGQLLRFADIVQAWCESRQSTTSTEEYDQLKKGVAELKVSSYGALLTIHGRFPYLHDPWRVPNSYNSQCLDALGTLVAGLAISPKPQTTSIFGSRRGSAAEDESDKSESTSPRGMHLQPPSTARTGSITSRSVSPSPFPDSLPRYRSFRAHGVVLQCLVILAAKTVSPAFRGRVLALLAQCTERREGPWSGAIASEVCQNLQNMEDQYRRAQAAGLGLGTGAAEEGEDSEDSDEEEDDSSDDDEAEADSDNASGTDSADATRKVTRAYADGLLEGRPFCAVAACMPRGNHGERCVWCSDVQLGVVESAHDGELSWEDIGARVVGGTCGFERLVRSRGGERRR